MLTESVQAITTATRQVLRNWSAMIVLAVLYAALIATLYLFVTTREASAAQVVVSLVLAIAAPFLFFVLQTASASQTRNLSPGLLVRESLKNSWKLIAVSVPLIVFAVLAVYLMGKAQAHFGAGNRDLSDLAAQYQWRAQNVDGIPPLGSSEVVLSSIRYLLIGLVLPLVAIHLWIASVGEGLLSTITKTKELIVRAFAPGSVLIYMAGFVVFGVVPYLLLFWATPASRAWIEIAFFVGRLFLVFVLTLFGWVVTMSALAISASERRHVRTARDKSCEKIVTDADTIQETEIRRLVRGHG